MQASRAQQVTLSRITRLALGRRLLVLDGSDYGMQDLPAAWCTQRAASSLNMENFARSQAIEFGSLGVRVFVCHGWPLVVDHLRRTWWPPLHV